MKEKSLYQCHVFICTNKRDAGRESCADKGSEDLRNNLKKWAQGKYGKKVRINTAGCLDFCEKGIVAVIYPEGEWHMSLKNTDLESLQKAIEDKLGS